MTQTIDEILAAIGGPKLQPAKPDGDSNVVPLNPTGLDKTTAEPFPANVEPHQGAGGAGYLTPGAQGSAADGTVEPGNDDHYSSQGGPAQRPTLSGVPSLTAGQTNTPADGSPMGAVLGEVPGGPQLPLGSNQGQGINPALKAALTPRLDGPFGKPS